MNPIVLVPRRPEPWRDQLWAAVEQHWQDGGYRVAEGLDVGPGPFNRSCALNRAASEHDGWDIAVVADADTIVPTDQVDTAVALTTLAGGLVLPFTTFVSLERQFTKELVAAGDLKPEASWLAGARWPKNNAVSSCVVVPRALWELAGGFDERFEGWGAEDRAFYLACTTLGPPARRVVGEVWHLWHPRSREKNPTLTTYQANFDLVGRYRAASGNPEAMRELLDERCA